MKEKVPFFLKTTPLYELMDKLGAKFVEFSGWYMPVNFKSGIVYEHKAVRKDAGLFDISHMGNIVIRGKDASKVLNYVGSNDILKIKPGYMQYHMFLNEEGGVIDDMMAYKASDNEIMLVCNAANEERVISSLKAVLNKFDFKIKQLDISAIAVQGPNSEKYLAKVVDNFPKLNNLEFKKENNLIISKSGYTGELGFEIYGPSKDIIKLTKDLLKEGVKPCGLGARDTLRFEAGLPLYGHELADFITPLEAGMKFSVDFNKDDFIGKKALLKQKDNLENKIYGLELIERGIARQGYSVYDKENEIGFITSGFMIPGTKNSYANAYLKSSYKYGDIVEIEIRKKKVKAKIRNKKYLK